MLASTMEVVPVDQADGSGRNLLSIVCDLQYHPGQVLTGVYSAPTVFRELLTCRGYPYSGAVKAPARFQSSCSLNLVGECRPDAGRRSIRRAPEKSATALPTLKVKETAAR